MNKIKTMQDWDASGKTFRNFCKDGDEIDEAIYHYFLGIVPPQYFNSETGIMMMGEPYSHDKYGFYTYLTFIMRDDKFFYLGLATMKEMGV